jgi:undecaprenyl-diphosphatase
MDLTAWRAGSSTRLWDLLDLVAFGRAETAVGALLHAATPGTSTVIAAGVALGLWWVGLRRWAVWSGLAAPVSVAVSDLVAKPLFDRTLNGFLAYPSGHTAAAVATGVVLVTLALRFAGPRRALLVLGLWSIVTGSLLVFILRQRSHYLTDIVGGIGMGVGVPALLAVVLTLGRDRPDQRRDVVSPAAEDVIETAGSAGAVAATAATTGVTAPTRRSSTGAARRRSHQTQPSATKPA